MHGTQKQLSIAAILGVVASVIGIWTFVSGRPSLGELFQLASRRSAEKQSLAWKSTSLPCLPHTRVTVDLPPAPLIEEHPTLDWVKFQDGGCKVSADRTLIAFQRCTAFDSYDQPSICLAYLAELARSPAHARLLTTNELEMEDNFFPIGFVGRSLVFAEPGTAYRFDTQTQRSHVLAEDAWAVSIQPGGEEIAFFTSYRSGEANLHTIAINGSNKRQRTHFKDCEGGPATLWPDWNSNVILFEMGCPPVVHEINTWKLDLTTNAVTRFSTGQIHG